MSDQIDITDRLITTIQDAKQPEVISVDGESFVTKLVYEPPLPDQPEPLLAHTLSAVVEYVNKQEDRLAADGGSPWLIQITDHKTVFVAGWLAEAGTRDQRRNYFLQSNAIVGSFEYGKFMTVEWFIICLQTQFAETDQLLAVIKAVSSLTDESVFTFADDGVTQQTSGRVGVVREGDIDLPRIVELRPYSTFKDVDRQPDRKFILRLRKGGEGKPPEAALFAADGDLWVNAAVALIKSYLDEHVEAGKAIIIG